jgi:tetratricopeptide (TPR) repeat protein
MIEIPFDVSYHLDENLRDIPNNPAQMQQAVEFLQFQLQQETKERAIIQLLGLLGVYARMLHDFPLAQKALTSAHDLSRTIGEEKLIVVNMIRLAHVYQWQQQYTKSEELFEEAITLCQTKPEISTYLDFAYQHLGKCKFDQKQYEQALYYFEQAKELRVKKGDLSLIESTQVALNTVNAFINTTSTYD